MSMFSILRESAERFPDRTALVFKEHTYTYEALHHAAVHLAARLSSFARPGDVVGLYLDHSDDWIISYFAVLGSGCVALPLSLRASDEALANQIRMAEPRAILASEKFFDRLSRLMGDMPNAPRILTRAMLAAMQTSPSFTPQSRQDEDLASIFFTSGTTGGQKGVMIPFRAVRTATKNIVQCLGLQDSERYFALLPFYHSFGLGNVHATLQASGTVVVSSAGTDLRQALWDIASHACTFFAATPLTLEQIMTYFREDMIAAGEHLRVLCTNTGPMPADVTKKILADLPNVQFHTYYGLTEASRSTFQHYNLHPDRLDSVGQAAPEVEIRIHDGEILLRGPHVTSGYLGNPELTKERLADGWLHTGDVGLMDADGFLYVTGRKDDQVDIGGERVALSEVDAVLRMVPGVKDAAACLGKERGRSIVVACIVSDLPALEDDVIAFCRTKLDTYKVPANVLVVPEIPKTESGKIQRKTLSERYAASLHS